MNRKLEKSISIIDGCCIFAVVLPIQVIFNLLYPLCVFSAPRKFVEFMLTFSMDLCKSWKDKYDHLYDKKK